MLRASTLLGQTLGIQYAFIFWVVHWVAAKLNGIYRKSCTILISGHPVCVHDGTWKECEVSCTPTGGALPLIITMVCTERTHSRGLCSPDRGRVQQFEPRLRKEDGWGANRFDVARKKPVVGMEESRSLCDLTEHTGRFGNDKSVSFQPHTSSYRMTIVLKTMRGTVSALVLVGGSMQHEGGHVHRISVRTALIRSTSLAFTLISPGGWAAPPYAVWSYGCWNPVLISRIWP